MASYKVKTASAGFGVFFLILLFAFGAFAFSTWIVMLVSGGLGHMFNQPALSISYWEAGLVTFALSVVGSFFRKN